MEKSTLLAPRASREKEKENDCFQPKGGDMSTYSRNIDRNCLLKLSCSTVERVKLHCTTIKNKPYYSGTPPYGHLVITDTFFLAALQTLVNTDNFFGAIVAVLTTVVKISKCKKVICPLCPTGNGRIKQIEFVCVFS